ncbi:uncharacterized protein [Physcomitrium patens]|uniref:Uncharacterized protein n=2 Tax=Physcomitrium patens TaxID=3218 RepID=A9RI44_PHYPA|nr:uncharacterized protein LOC112276093 isoform X2 [Physcomitrium patens]PNR29138.1 hypothetical protein PHYPA_027830 [Physcomitrium patens]|eukprot:XP_024362866.1 uncharacterized protein LOC112276093 isoform X2 [Physcomitrella patens]
MLMEGGSLPPRKRLLAGLKQNGWLSTSPPPAVSSSGAAEDAVGLGNHAEERAEVSASVGLNGLSQVLKKPRVVRYADGSRFGRQVMGPDAAGEEMAGRLGASRKMPSLGLVKLEGGSPQEAAVAARNAAAAAAKVAAAAKANAAAKVSAAVKAGAAAKAALEAVAYACRAEAACGAELQRKMIAEKGSGGGNRRMRLEINMRSKPHRDRSWKGEGYGGRRLVDDVQLARQLHRVVNNSPRVSRSTAPLRRKVSMEPQTPLSGVSSSITEAIKSRALTCGVVGAEDTQLHGKGQNQNGHGQQQEQHAHVHVQFRQQQTRPRSITHRESRRIDNRTSRHEVKMTKEGKSGVDVGMNGGEVEEMQLEGLEVLGDAGMNALDDFMRHQRMVEHGGEEVSGNVKTEAIGGVMEFDGGGVADEASMFSDALVKADGAGVEGRVGGVGVNDERRDYLQKTLEAAVLTDTAVPFNEGGHVEVSEIETVRAEAGGAVIRQDMEHGQPQEVVGSSGLGGMGIEAGWEGEAQVQRDVYERMASEPTLVIGGVCAVQKRLTAAREERVAVDDVEMGDIGEEITVGPSSTSEVRSEALSVVQDWCSSGPRGLAEVGLEESDLGGWVELRERVGTRTGVSSTCCLESGSSTMEPEEEKCAHDENALVAVPQASFG